LCGELLHAWGGSLKRETAEAYVVVATFPDAPEQSCLAASLAKMGRRAANMAELVALMTFGQLAKDSKSNGPSGSLLQRRMVMAQHIKNVVLVHGAFADGSGWEPVANILMNDGYKVSVAQPPETSYADDVKYTKAAIDAMDGPVVLVGHSYGGSIITEAGNHPKVVALVYIAAFALDEGESCASIEQAVPSSIQGVQARQQWQLVDRTGAFRGRLRSGHPEGKGGVHGYITSADLHGLVHP